MSESGREDILVMAILTVTRDDVLACASDLGIPEGQVTDDVIELVKGKVSQGLHDWREAIKGVVKEAISKEAVDREAIKCPLGMVCSPSCAWREVGGCILPGVAK